MTPKPPPSLVRNLAEGRCVLFVGSGLSASAGLPTWTSLLTAMVDELDSDDPDSPEVSELRGLIAAGKLLEVADFCRTKFSGGRYAAILAERLRAGAGDVPDVHRVVARLPFAAIVTTNYDKLLERTYASVGNFLPKTLTQLDSDSFGTLLFDRSFFILKAHGDIDKPDSLVLTARDYREIIHRNPAFDALFSAILQTHAVLFVGYSLNDPDFRLLFDRQLTLFKGYTPDRYALMGGLGQVQRQLLRETAQIKVLSYPAGEHQEVQNFLVALLEAVDDWRASAVAGPNVTPRGSSPVPSFGGPSSELAMPQDVERDRVADSSVATTLEFRLRGAQLESVLSGPVSARGLVPVPDWKEMAPSLGRAALDAHKGAAGEIAVVAELIGSCLDPDVREALGRVPEGTTIRLGLTPTLEPFPWEWIPVGKTPLVLRNAVVRDPIGVSAEARGLPPLRPSLRALLIGDPGENLPGAAAEVQALAEVYRSAPDAACVALYGPEATFENVLRLLLGEPFDVIHFAGHAWFDADGVFIALHGDVHLWANELRTLLSPRPPALLCLNSHFTAMVPPGVREPGAAIAAGGLRGQPGFTQVASATGVGAFVGCFGSPSDLGAQRLGVTLHRDLLSGARAADAFRRGVQAAAEDLERDSTALFYLMSGYPDLTLRAPS